MIDILQFWMVAKRTYLNRLKSFSFWALIIGPLMVPIIAIGINYMGNKTSNPKLAVVGQPEIAQFLKTSKSSELKIYNVNDKSVAQKRLNNEKIDGFLTESDGKFTLFSTSKNEGKFDQSILKSELTQYQIVSRAAEMHLSSTEVAALLSPSQLTTKMQSANGHQLDSRQTNANVVLSIVAVVGIFIFLTLYVGVISQEIANEKSNRIMEILLAATSSRVQYYGKILGVVLLAVTHIAIYAVSGTILYLVFKTNSLVKSITSLLTGLNVAFAIYIAVMSFIAVVGFLVLASIVASLVNDQSQAQQATQPVIYLGMIGYIASFVLSTDPSNLVLQVMSFIPFISPTMMTARYANQSVGLQEAMVALLLQIVAVVLVMWFGEKIYARNVLSYNDGNLIKQLFKNLRGRSNNTISGHNGVGQ